MKPLLFTTCVAIAACTSTGGPATGHIDRLTGTCGGLLAVNLSTPPILKEDIAKGRALCAKDPVKPCLSVIIKHDVNNYSYTCAEVL